VYVYVLLLFASSRPVLCDFFVFLFTDPSPTVLYTLSLHDALPICPGAAAQRWCFHLRRGNGAHREPRGTPGPPCRAPALSHRLRSEEHTSELQSRENLVCRLLLEKKKQNENTNQQLILMANLSTTY